MSSRYLYVTYIRTTPQKLWDALTKPEFIKQYWFNMTQESTWKAGASWQMLFSDGRVADAGEVLESDPPRRLVLKWRNEFRPELKEEGYSRCVYDLEQDGEVMKLTITHTIEKDGAKIIEAVAGGWPRVLSSLKSFLETGKPMPSSHQASKA
ncbi:MAG: SRPBCC family protein [Rhizomicrobium sp.]